MSHLHWKSSPKSDEGTQKPPDAVAGTEDTAAKATMCAHKMDERNCEQTLDFHWEGVAFTNAAK